MKHLLALDKLDEQVVVTCYNQDETMSRREAMEKYFDCMLNSEGSEHKRYETIFFQLLLGYVECCDRIPFYDL